MLYVNPFIKITKNIKHRFSLNPYSLSVDGIFIIYDDTTAIFEINGSVILYIHASYGELKSSDTIKNFLKNLFS